jgi:hypothetical protein
MELLVLVAVQAVTIGSVPIPWTMVTGILLGGVAFGVLKGDVNSHKQALGRIERQFTEAVGRVETIANEANAGVGDLKVSLARVEQDIAHITRDVEALKREA